MSSGGKNKVCVNLYDFDATPAKDNNMYVYIAFSRTGMAVV